jgi:YegS C-terminal NAD kinase beta sandwich-like domain
MTVERGGAWGRVAPLPADGVIVRSDRDAAAVVADARARGSELPTIGLLGGDLCKTLGGTGDEDRLRGSDAVTLPIDVAEADVNGHAHVFLAHVVARRSWWTGRVWAAMNAEWLGDWDVAPRAHPGDGLLDTLDVSMSLRDRIKARRRLATGTHVPHSAIAQQRRGRAEVTFDSALGIWIDGLRLGDATSLVVRVTGEVIDVVV